MKLLLVVCILFHITSFNSVCLASGENNQFERNSPLHEAVLDDNFLGVKKLINQGADKNAKNHFGRTPLHLAAERGFENIVRLLIVSHAEIDVKDNFGKISLFLAAQNGHFEVFRLLIQEYENRSIDIINATDTMGMSLIHFAAMNKKSNNIEVLKILLEKGSNVNSIARDNTTPLDYAATTGNPEMVRLLLDAGAVFNVNLRDSTGDTPIMYAAYGTGENRQKVFQLLIKNNADLTNINDLGETALFFVARFGGDDQKLAEFLIESGAKVNISNNHGETPLHHAAKSGYRKLGECFIKNNVNKDAKTEESQTPLHYAVKFGQFKFAEMLINHGANVNVVDDNHNTALHYAVNAELGHVDILELLSKGDNIDNFKKDGKSLLHLFIEKGGDMENFKWLLNKGANVKVTDSDGRSILHSAARYGRTEVLEWLIDNNYPIEEILNKADNYGNTPLHYAISGSYYDVTNILLSKGADANAMNNEFEYPVHLAAQSGNEGIVKLLNKYDAKVNVRNRIYWTPLFFSVASGNEKVVKVLIKYDDEDYSLNDMDAEGKTVFHICATKGSVNIGKILYSYGANVTAVDENGRTPLHIAAQSGNSEFISWLINLQSDDHDKVNHVVDVIDKNGDTPLHLATREGQEKAVNVLLHRRKSDVKKNNKNNNTPLHYAAQYGYVNIAKMLLMAGADINTKTNNNQTAILLAIQNGNHEVVDELLKSEADTRVPDDDEKTLLDVAKQHSNDETIDRLTKHETWIIEEARLFHILIFMLMMILVPLVIYILLFFHKLCRKEATDSGTVLKLTDLLERYMFPQSQLMLSTKIGKGVFGTIYKGYAHKILHNSNETLVAIKEIKGSTKEADSHLEAQKLLSLGSELKLLMQCGGHLNLVNLLGIVAENIANHELMVIFEYCRYGTLRDALAVSVTRNNLASWSYQIAQGMQFLASRKIIHGNLAARSILLADGNVAKISDFGLARAMYKTETYIAEKEGKLEYKWLSIESMQNKILTTKSDVWSFGIVLWEIFSFGQMPYKDIEIYQLKRHILNGHTMEKPPNANDNMYEIMQHCWRRNPESRPSFNSLEKWLYQFL